MNARSRIPALIAAGLAIGLVAPAAYAQYGEQHVPQPEAAGPTEGTRPGRTDQLVVDGTVTRLQRDAGDVWVRTGERTVHASFPRDALAGIREGDRVTLRLGIRRLDRPDSTSSEGAGSPATEPEEGSPGVRPPGALPR